jgi:hypothetical protein
MKYLREKERLNVDLNVLFDDLFENASVEVPENFDENNIKHLALAYYYLGRKSHINDIRDSVEEIINKLNRMGKY